MKGAWVGNETEAELLRKAARNLGREDWKIDAFEPNIAYAQNFLANVLEQYDFIVLPLSLPGWSSLRLPELANRLGSKTNLILRSRTDADKVALSTLFDAAFGPASLMTDIVVRAEQPSTRERRPEITSALIRTIVDSSSMLRLSDAGRTPSLDDIRNFEFPPHRGTGKGEPISPPPHVETGSPGPRHDRTMKVLVTTTIGAAVLLSCSYWYFRRQPSQCVVAPPHTSGQSDAQTLAIDLEGMVQGAPAKGALDANAERMISQSFFRVADTDLVCQMILQASVCMAEAGKAEASIALVTQVNAKCRGATSQP